MQPSDRKALLVGGVIIAGIVGAYLTEGLTQQKLLYAGLTVAVIGGGYVVYRDKHLLQQWKNQVGLEQDPLQNALTEEEARQKVEQWAKTYSKGGLKFHFANAESDSVELDKGEDKKELLRYFFTSFAGGQRGKIVFVECVRRKDVVGHATVKYTDQVENPFQYSEYYQDYIRQKKIEAYRDSYKSRRTNRKKPTEATGDE